MRKTKIICTIGPACEDEETLTALCLAGMNVARLNFSHGTQEEHQRRIDLIKKVRDKLNLPILPAAVVDRGGFFAQSDAAPLTSKATSAMIFT